MCSNMFEFHPIKIVEMLTVLAILFPCNSVWNLPSGFVVYSTGLYAYIDGDSF